MGGGTVVDEDTQVTDSVDWLNGRTSDRDRTARKLQLPMCRRTSHRLGLVGIEPEPIRGHPAGNLVDSTQTAEISVDRVEIATGVQPKIVDTVYTMVG